MTSILWLCYDGVVNVTHLRELQHAGDPNRMRTLTMSTQSSEAIPVSIMFPHPVQVVYINKLIMCIGRTGQYAMNNQMSSMTMIGNIVPKRIMS